MIAVTFKCGHTTSLKGDEEGPRCHCGETRITVVKAKAPQFRGHVLGPCAEFDDKLTAKAVSLESRR